MSNSIQDNQQLKKGTDLIVRPLAKHASLQEFIVVFDAGHEMAIMRKTKWSEFVLTYH
jgi:predicted RNA-binding protein with PIN domain